MRKGIRTLKNGYSSPYGRVHNSRITTEPKIYSGCGILMNSINVGHVISGSGEYNIDMLPMTENTSSIENNDILSQQPNELVLTKKLIPIRKR